jgi:hypothetical protein
MRHGRRSGGAIRACPAAHCAAGLLANSGWQPKKGLAWWGAFRPFPTVTISGRASARITKEHNMSTTNTTRDGQVSEPLASTVADFEAACFDLLRAFNDAGACTQSLILNMYVDVLDVNGFDFRFGALNLAEGVAAMKVATTEAGGPALDRQLVEAADRLAAASSPVVLALSDADESTLAMTEQGYLSGAWSRAGRPHIPFIAAGVAEAVSSVNGTDAIGLTLDLLGDGQAMRASRISQRR